MTKVWNHLVSFQLNDYQCFEFSASQRTVYLLISILPKNHAGTVEKLISDFFRMPKKVSAIDSL